jgi:hypothetical protein
LSARINKNNNTSQAEEYNDTSVSMVSRRDGKIKDADQKSIDEMSIHNPKHPSRWRDLDKLISLLQT